jgi:murein DD-endopeptidase MepM/ murein hydrolase activator NlpD
MLRTPRLARVAAIALLATLAACTRHYPPAPVVAGNGVAPRLGAEPISPGPRPDSIVVARGETLYAISRRWEVPIRSLIEANNLTPPFALAAGQRLILPDVRQYIVQRGDSLNSVSRRFGVDSSTLARTNNLAPPYPIQVGQALILPAAVQSAGAQPTAVAETRPGPAPAPLIVAQPLAAPAPVAPGTAANPPPEPTVAAATPRPEPVEAKPGELAAPQKPAGPQVAAIPPAAPPPPPPPQAAPAPVATPEAPPAAPAHTGPGFQWPVRGSILVGYGPGAAGTQNDGINIGAAAGTAVAAANDGVVAYAGNELRGFGNLILIKHADGWTTAYAHCETLLVKRGDRVKRGQTIARVGQTGAVAEPQLHFEMRRGTQPLDPTSYLPPVSTASAE